MAQRGSKPGSEAAKRGGRILGDKYGPGRLTALGKKGGAALHERADPAYFAKLGRKCW